MSAQGFALALLPEQAVYCNREHSRAIMGRPYLYRFPFPWLKWLVGVTFLFCATAMALPQTLHFGPDGRRLAVTDDQNRLFVINLEEQGPARLLAEGVQGPPLWNPQGDALFLALDLGTGHDLYRLGLQGEKQRLTDHPAREGPIYYGPALPGLVYLSWKSGAPELMLWEPRNQSSRPFLRIDSVGAATFSFSQGGTLALLGFFREGLALKTALPGRELAELFQFEKDLFSSQEGPTCWDSDVLYFAAGADRRRQIWQWFPPEENPRLLGEGQFFTAFQVDRARNRLYLESDKGLRLLDLQKFIQNGLREEGHWVRALDLPVRQGIIPPKLSQLELAGIVGDRAIGLFSDLQSPPRLLFLSLEDELATAEKLMERRRFAEAEELYSHLAFQYPDPETSRRIQVQRAVQLRRNGQVQKALAQLQLLAQSAKGFSEEDPRLDLARLSFFELNNPERARTLLREAWADCPESRQPLWHSPQWEALAVLETQDEELISLYRKAHAALRQDREGACLTFMTELAEEYGDHPLMPAILLNLLNQPYAEESLATPEEAFADFEKKERLARILMKVEDEHRENWEAENSEDRAGENPEEIRRLFYEELFRALLDARRFSDTRKLVDYLVRQDGLDFLEIPSLLQYYLEWDRADEWVHLLMSQVLLTVPLRKTLKEHMKKTEDRAFLELAWAKLALLEGNMDRLQERLNGTNRLFHEWEETGLPPEVARLQFYLFLFSAKRYERLGQWEMAMERYATAQNLLSQYEPDRVELVSRIMAARAEIATGRAWSQQLQEIHLILRGMGDEIINLTNDPGQLRIGLENLLALLRNRSPSPLDCFLLAHIGIIAGRAELFDMSRVYLDRALNARPPESLLPLLYLEKAALYEATENWWLQDGMLQNAAALPLPEEMAQAFHLQRLAPLLRLDQRERAKTLLTHLLQTSNSVYIRERATQEINALGFE